MTRTTKEAAAHTDPATTPDRPALVTEIELAALKRDRAVLDGLATQAKALAKNLDDREADLIARIEGGAEVVGAIQPTVKLATRRSVSWVTSYAELARRFGLDHQVAIREVKDAAPVTMFKSLQIP